ncbi:MAG: shikimate dehydrogenase [Muribaculaceae bacterium]|nr:shikimate dehydrogenase [Muribaculaceae bacterium]
MYGLIGNPLGHSFSADFFNEKFKKEEINESYKLFPLENIELLPSLLEKYPHLKGLNVTIPYKREVLQYLDSLSDAVKEIGAVNVIKIIRSQHTVKLIGYNSDAVGFRKTIEPLLKPYMTKALVLGTGGASKAVIYVLKSLGLEVISVSRERTESSISYSDLSPELLTSCFVIVNTTPLGMWPKVDEAPDLPYSALTKKHLLYDLVYNPQITEFMKKGALRGATVKNGLDMLHEQAIEAWRIWNQ